jgi:outer membrane protein TolC
VTFDRGSLGVLPGVGEVPSRDTTISTPRQWTTALEAGVGQPLTQLYRIFLAIDQAELRRKIAQEQLRLQRQTVADDVKRAYYALLQTQSALDATEETLRFLRELVRVVGENVARQTALRADLLDAQTRLARAEYDALTHRNTLQNQRAQFNDLLGRDIDTEFRVQPVGEVTAVEADLAAARARALRQRPQLSRTRPEVQAAESRVRIKAAEYIPDLHLVVKYFSPITSDVLPKNIAYAGVELSWDVWDWGRRRQEMEVRRKEVGPPPSRPPVPAVPVAAIVRPSGGAGFAAKPAASVEASPPV